MASREVAAHYEGRIRELEGKLDLADKYFAMVLEQLSTPNIIHSGRDTVLALGSGSVSITNIEQATCAINEIIDAVKEEEDKSFKGTAKKTLLGLLGDVARDIAKGQLKEAGSQLAGLAFDLAPVMVRVGAQYSLLSLLGNG